MANVWASVRCCLWDSYVNREQTIKLNETMNIHRHRENSENSENGDVIHFNKITIYFVIFLDMIILPRHILGWTQLPRTTWRWPLKSNQLSAARHIVKLLKWYPPARERTRDPRHASRERHVQLNGLETDIPACLTSTFRYQIPRNPLVRYKLLLCLIFF